MKAGEPEVQSYLRDVLDYYGLTRRQAGQALRRLVRHREQAATLPSEEEFARWLNGEGEDPCRHQPEGR